MKVFTLVALLLGSQVHAQTESKAFPTEAEQLSATALQEIVGGKSFSFKFINGTYWTWNFNSNGYFNFRTSDGFQDTGKWNIKESTLCTDGRRINASCNEIRKQGAQLFFKRDNGDVIEMVPQ